MDLSASAEEPSDEIEKLRRYFRKCWAEVIIVIMDLVAEIHEQNAKQKIGPKDIRIGVFGPYPGTYKQIVMQVARYISELGFASITGEGFYLPNSPMVFHDIKEISPEVVTDIFKHPEVPQYNYYYVLPRLVKKALFLMNDERGQTIELIGCFDAFIPVLGFIVHDTVTYGDKDCVYLFKEHEISLCGTANHLSCLGNALQRPCCPFYDSIDIPWLSKQLFLRRPENHLIGVKRVEDIEPILKNFVTSDLSRC